ncbi:MAG: MurR/RpiR family transcriptional regulator [Clostridia bacterium]|nr:MurR/RpiR family transcriptional regulator [Clostridia bacterium]
MKGSLLTQIEEQYPKLSKSHKRIADYILRNYEKAAFFTAAKLGEETGISVSTVVRFATQMGFEGYPEFQDALRETIKGKLTSTQRMAVADQQSTDEELLESVLAKDMEMIKETLRTVSKEDFRQAAEAINHAKRIYLIGVRSAASLASFMYFYLNQIYDDVHLITTNSSSEMFEELFRIGPDDVCLVATFPRYSTSVYKMGVYAHEKQAKIIAITDNESAPVAAIADYLLIAKSSMASYLDSLVAPLSLINALILAASGERRDSALINFGELERVWDRYNVYAKLEEEENG